MEDGDGDDGNAVAVEAVGVHIRNIYHLYCRSSKVVPVAVVEGVDDRGHKILEDEVVQTGEIFHRLDRNSRVVEGAMGAGTQTDDVGEGAVEVGTVRV